MTIKVAVSFIFYPVAIGRYFLEALQKRDDVEVWSCGPFSGNYIPWAGGLRLPQKYVISPDLALHPQFTNPYPVEIINAQMPWKPDLFLIIDAGFHFNKRPNANSVAHIQTDPHAIPRKFYELPKSYSDLKYTMQMAYRQDDELYLPYAASTDWFYPEDLPKEYDACLIGLQYAHRMKLVTALRNNKIRVYSDIGKVYNEYRELYNKSKVALSWSSLNDTPCRVFEGMAMKLPVLCNRTPDLMSLFVENDHFVGFNNVDEAIFQMSKLLSDENLRDEIAGNAYRKVVAQHTFDIRIQQILEQAKLI